MGIAASFLSNLVGVGAGLLELDLTEVSLALTRDGHSGISGQRCAFSRRDREFEGLIRHRSGFGGDLLLHGDLELDRIRRVRVFEENRKFFCNRADVLTVVLELVGRCLLAIHLVAGNLQDVGVGVLHRHHNGPLLRGVFVVSVAARLLLDRVGVGAGLLELDLTEGSGAFAHDLHIGISGQRCAFSRRDREDEFLILHRIGIAGDILLHRDDQLDRIRRVRVVEDDRSKRIRNRADVLAVMRELIGRRLLAIHLVAGDLQDVGFGVLHRHHNGPLLHGVFVVGIAAPCLLDRVGVGAGLLELDRIEVSLALTRDGHSRLLGQRRAVGRSDREFEGLIRHRSGFGGNLLLHGDLELDRIRRVRVGDNHRVVGHRDRAEVGFAVMHARELFLAQRDGLFAVRGGISRDLQDVGVGVLHRHSNGPFLRRVFVVSVAALCLSNRVGVGASLRELDLSEILGVFAGHCDSCLLRLRCAVSSREREGKGLILLRLGFAGDILLHRNLELDRFRRVRVGDNHRVVSPRDRAEVGIFVMHARELILAQRDGHLAVRGGISRDLQDVGVGVLHRHSNGPLLRGVFVVSVAALCLSNRVGVGAGLREHDLAEVFGFFAGHCDSCLLRHRCAVSSRECEGKGLLLLRLGFAGDILLHRDLELDGIRLIRVGDNHRVGRRRDRADVVAVHGQEICLLERDGLFAVCGGISRDHQLVAFGVLHRNPNGPLLIRVGVVSVAALCLLDLVGVDAGLQVLDLSEVGHIRARDGNSGISGQRCRERAVSHRDRKDEFLILRRSGFAGDFLLRRDDQLDRFRRVCVGDDHRKCVYRRGADVILIVRQIAGISRYGNSTLLDAVAGDPQHVVRGVRHRHLNGPLLIGVVVVGIVARHLLNRVGVLAGLQILDLTEGSGAGALDGHRCRIRQRCVSRINRLDREDEFLVLLRISIIGNLLLHRDDQLDGFRRVRVVEDHRKRVCRRGAEIIAVVRELFGCRRLTIHFVAGDLQHVSRSVLHRHLNGPLLIGVGVVGIAALCLLDRVGVGAGLRVGDLIEHSASFADDLHARVRIRQRRTVIRCDREGEGLIRLRIGIAGNHLFHGDSQHDGIRRVRVVEADCELGCHRPADVVVVVRQIRIRLSRRGIAVLRDAVAGDLQDVRIAVLHRHLNGPHRCVVCVGRVAARRLNDRVGVLAGLGVGDLIELTCALAGRGIPGHTHSVLNLITLLGHRRVRRLSRRDLEVKAHRLGRLRIAGDNLLHRDDQLDGIRRVRVVEDHRKRIHRRSADVVVVVRELIGVYSRLDRAAVLRRHLVAGDLQDVGVGVRHYHLNGPLLIGVVVVGIAARRLLDRVGVGAGLRVGDLTEGSGACALDGHSCGIRQRCVSRINRLDREFEGLSCLGIGIAGSLLLHRDDQLDRLRRVRVVEDDLDLFGFRLAEVVSIVRQLIARDLNRLFAVLLHGVLRDLQRIVVIFHLHRDCPAGLVIVVVGISAGGLLHGVDVRTGLEIINRVEPGLACALDGHSCRIRQRRRVRGVGSRDGEDEFLILRRSGIAADNLLHRDLQLDGIRRVRVVEDDLDLFGIRLAEVVSIVRQRCATDRDSRHVAGAGSTVRVHGDLALLHRVLRDLQLILNVFHLHRDSPSGLIVAVVAGVGTGFLLHGVDILAGLEILDCVEPGLACALDGHSCRIRQRRRVRGVGRRDGELEGLVRRGNRVAGDNLLHRNLQLDRSRCIRVVKDDLDLFGFGLAEVVSIVRQLIARDLDRLFAFLLHAILRDLQHIVDIFHLHRDRPAGRIIVVVGVGAGGLCHGVDIGAGHEILDLSEVGFTRARNGHSGISGQRRRVRGVGRRDGERKGLVRRGNRVTGDNLLHRNLQLDRIRRVRVVKDDLDLFGFRLAEVVSIVRQLIARDLDRLFAVLLHGVLRDLQHVLNVFHFHRDRPLGLVVAVVAVRSGFFCHGVDIGAGLEILDRVEVSLVCARDGHSGISGQRRRVRGVGRRDGERKGLVRRGNRVTGDNLLHRNLQLDRIRRVRVVKDDLDLFGFRLAEVVSIVRQLIARDLDRLFAVLLHGVLRDLQHVLNVFHFHRDRPLGLVVAVVAVRSGFFCHGVDIGAGLEILDRVEVSLVCARDGHSGISGQRRGIRCVSRRDGELEGLVRRGNRVTGDNLLHRNLQLDRSRCVGVDKECGIRCGLAILKGNCSFQLAILVFVRNSDSNRVGQVRVRYVRNLGALLFGNGVGVGAGLDILDLTEQGRQLFPLLSSAAGRNRDADLVAITSGHGCVVGTGQCEVEGHIHRRIVALQGLLHRNLHLDRFRIELVDELGARHFRVGVGRLLGMRRRVSDALHLKLTGLFVPDDLDRGSGLTIHLFALPVNNLGFFDLEGVGADTVERQLIKAAERVGLAGLLVALDRDAQGLDGIHRLQRGVLGVGGGQHTGEPQLELEGVLVLREALKEFPKVQLNLNTARVGHSDLIHRSDLGLAGDLQHEAVVTHRADPRVRGRIAGGRNADRLVGFGNVDLFDLVFLPPVQTGDFQLAVCTSHKLSFGAVGIQLIDTVVECELQQAGAAGNSRFLCEAQIGVFIRTVDGELRAGDRGLAIVGSQLGEFQAAGHLEADILGLIPKRGVADKERLRREGSSGGGREVAVQRVACGSGQFVIGIIGHIMSTAPVSELEDIHQARVTDRRIEHVTGRILALQRLDIQLLINIGRDAIQLSGREEVREYKVPNRFAKAGVRIRAVIGVLRIRFGTAAGLVIDDKGDGICQLVDNGILAVITAANMRYCRICFLFRIPVFVDPHVAFDLNQLIHQGHVDSVGFDQVEGSQLLVIEPEVVGCVGERNLVEVLLMLRIAGDLFHDGMVGHDHGASAGQVAFRTKDNDEGGNSAAFLNGSGTRRRPALRGEISVLSGFTQVGLHTDLGRGTGVIPHRVVRIRKINAVRNDSFNVIEVYVPGGVAVIVIADLRNDVADHEIVCSFSLAVVDGQTPLGPALVTRCVTFFALIEGGTGAPADILVVEAVVTVTPDTLADTQGRTLNDVQYVFCADKRIDVLILILQQVEHIIVHALLMGSRGRIVRIIRGYGQSIAPGVSACTSADRKGIAVRVLFCEVALARGGEIHIVTDLFDYRNLSIRPNHFPRSIEKCAGHNLGPEGHRFRGSRFQISAELEDYSGLGVTVKTCRGVYLLLHIALYREHIRRRIECEDFALCTGANLDRIGHRVILELHTGGQNIHQHGIMEQLFGRSAVRKRQ